MALRKEQLDASEERYRRIIEDQTEFIVRWQPDGTRTFVNDSYCRYYGIKREDALGSSFFPLISKEDRETVRSRIALLTPATPVSTGEHKVIRPDGTSGWNRWTDRAFYDETGKVLEYQSVGQDITIRKLAEQALRRSETRLAKAERISHLGYWTYDVATGHIEWSDELYRIFGWKPQSIDLTHETILAAVKPDDRERQNAYFERMLVLRPGESLENLEYRLERPDGEERWVDVLFEADFDEHGNVAAFFGIVHDITERKHAEEALRKTRDKLSLIYNSSHEYMILMATGGPDGDYVFESCNDAFLNANRNAGIDITHDQIVGMGVRFFLREWVRATPEKIQFIYDKYAAAIAARKTLQYEEETRLEDVIIYTETTITPIFSDHGHCTHILYCSRDITDRRQAEEALRKALTEVEELTSRLQKENVYLRDEIKVQHQIANVIGTSDSLRKVLKQVEQVAPTDTGVLVLGETGTGKELIARGVHELSLRREHPLVKVNCAALPANLIESELFGHEKGAFTGALVRRMGRFELADRGSIFLDEIGDLPLELQVKLLRVLQDGEFDRVGSHESTRVDVRVIAATNRNLQKLVREGAFREDLFFRLHIFPIHVPPLRERRQDIPLLAKHFIERYNPKLGKQIDQVPERVMQALQEYDWPGNVRELENVIERAMIVSRGASLELGEWFLPGTGKDDGQSSPLSMRELERQHVLEVLRRTTWRVSGPGGAAEILGLKPTTLEARMKKLGIRRAR